MGLAGVHRPLSQGHHRDWRTGAAIPLHCRPAPRDHGGCCSRVARRVHGLLCFSWVLWGCRLSRHGFGSGLASTASAVPRFSLLCVSQCPRLYTDRCVEPPASGVLGGGPMLSYRRFTGCRRSGEDKGGVSCCHDADLTLGL